MAMQRRLQFISDRDLVGMAQLGSGEACDELVSRFRGGVLMVAEQNLGSWEAAQDVTQEAFLIAFRALSQLQNPAKFAGWLYTITRHHARRVAMRDGRLKLTEASQLEQMMTVEPGGNAASPLEALILAEKQASIRALLGELTPDVQIVLKLFYYEQWAAVRIAEFLSLPLSTIKWRLRSGRAQLSGRLAHLLEEKPDVRSRTEKRDTPNPEPAAKDRGAVRACRADGQLRERRSQLGAALQCDCGAP